MILNEKKTLSFKGIADVNLCFMWAFESLTYEMVTLDCVLFFRCEPASGGGSSCSYWYVLVLLAWAVTTWKIEGPKIDIACFWMGISFPFPTTMCKHKLHCCQVAGFLWRENSSQNLLGENSSWHIYVAKKGLNLPSLKPDLTVLCTCVRLKNRSTNMRETIITGEYAGRLESLLAPFLVVYWYKESKCLENTGLRYF